MRSSTRRGGTRPRRTASRCMLRHGWDGEPGRHFLVDARQARTSASPAVHTRTTTTSTSPGSTLLIHPERRRRGFGTAGVRAASSTLARCDGPDQARLGRLGRRAHRRVRRGPGLGARSPSPSTGASTCASSSRAWPTGCTTRRWRTPATTSWSASRAASPDELLRGARRRDSGHQRRAARRPRHRGRGLHRRPGGGVRERPARERLPLLPDHRPAPRDRRDRRPDGGHRRLRDPGAGAPARHLRRARRTAGTGSACC